MTYLFIFAHPDDETVACAGTIKKLSNNGDKVVVVSVTPGDAGEVTTQKAKDRLKKLGSVTKLREKEFKEACKILGVSECRILNYKDGTITNKLVWGRLKEDVIDLFSEIKPDVVVTFDHAGWYYHLDHIGVSIATTLAYHQAKYKPAALLLSHFHIAESKWNHYYVFQKTIKFTHYVDIKNFMDVKLASIATHNSQDLSVVKEHFEKNTTQEEYILAFSNYKGKKLMANHSVFERVKS